jgi:hypothetical protein
MHPIGWEKAWFRLSAPIDSLPVPRDWFGLVLVLGSLLAAFWMVCWAANRVFVVSAETEGDYDGLAPPQPSAQPELAWESCSEDEKLALFQLAEENFVNPNRWRAIRRLRQVGLIRRDPALSLDPKFRQFVLATLTEETVHKLEHGGRPSVWVELRTPLAALSLLVAGFFLLTQPDIFNSAVGVATALAGALAFVPRILASLGANEQKSEK